MDDGDRGGTRYRPIEDYGVVGDLHTVALVGKDGSVDLMSFPGFDSPAIFAALLDHPRVLVRRVTCVRGQVGFGHRAC